MRIESELGRSAAVSKERVGTAAGVIGVLILFVALRWNNFDAPLTRDEGEYAYAAQLLLHGQLPYEHSFLQKPPMVAYSYLLANWLAPGIFWSPRLLAYLFIALTTVLLGYTARRDFGSNVAWGAVWIVTPMVLLPALGQFPANTEMFMLLPIVAMVALSYRNSRVAWIVGGALAAIIVLYKYTAIALPALIFVAWSVRQWREQRSLCQLSACWMLALLGAAITAAALLGPFLISDGGKHLWQCNVEFNRWYAASENFGWSALGVRIQALWQAWWILFFLPLFVFLRPRPRIGFWIAAFGVACLTTAASRYEHYYITLMPFWAVLTAVGIVNLSNWINSKIPSRFGNWVAPVLTATAVAAICLPEAPWMLRFKERFVLDKLKSWSPFVAAPVVAKRVAELSAPTDSVCVAGSEPEILYYAQRFSPTRFVIAYPLTMPSPLVRGFQSEAIADIEAKPPAVLVLVRSPASWASYEQTPADYTDYLKKIISENYDMIGGYLLQDDSGHWQEPLGSDEMVHTNFIVFKRRNL